MITENKSILEDTIDLSPLGITFSSKPTLIGGLAIEYYEYKVMSFEKLFFMKVIAYKSQPKIPKHTNDFELMIKYYYDTFRNKDYVENAMKHMKKYETAPDGTILGGNY